MLRRLLIAASVLLFLVGILAALWNLCDWPPPRLILEYGFPPTGGPTGRTMTIEGVEFVELKPGYFRMGSHFLCEQGDLLGRVCALLHLPWGKQPKHVSEECPPHWVELRSVFWIARCEVTNDQFERFDARHERGEYSPDSEAPVTYVDRGDAREYCEWLSDRGALQVRLPSEAEWEYACRAGSSKEFCFGDDESKLGEYSWCRANSGGRAHAVGTKRANAWGLHDLHGNVAEWCEDTYHVSYVGAPSDGTSWSETEGEAWEPDTGSFELLRGGEWGGTAWNCRSAFRLGTPWTTGWRETGFRVAATGR